ncbi:unnamed protein product [Heterobilharzia americana]|nr:unnamed protein product [Heterobilharzia americana]
MNKLFRRLSITNDNDNCFRHKSIIPIKDLSVNTLEIQKLLLNNLSTIDVERIISLLDNLITRILLISLFPKILNKLQEYSLVLGRNVTVLFEIYGSLSKICNEYEVFNSGAVNIRPKYIELERSVNKTKRIYTSQLKESSIEFDLEDPLTTPKKDIQKVISRLYDVTRSLLRDLMANPLAVSILIHHREEWVIESSDSCQKLVKLLIHLRTLTRNELFTAQGDKTKGDEYLECLRLKDLEQTKQIEILTETYNRLKSTQFSQTTQRMDEIRELKSRILHIQNVTQAKLSEFKQKYCVSQQIAYNKHQESIQSMKMFLEAVKAQLKELTERSIENEHKLRSEKWKIEDTICAEISKNDSDLFEIQVKYDEYLAEYEKECLACEQLRMKVEPLKTLADVVLEEYHLENEKKTAEIIDREDRRKAATIIQSLWRSSKTRKIIKAERRKKRQ